MDLWTVVLPSPLQANALAFDVRISLLYMQYERECIETNFERNAQTQNQASVRQSPHLSCIWFVNQEFMPQGSHQRIPSPIDPSLQWNPDKYAENLLFLFCRIFVSSLCLFVCTESMETEPVESGFESS
jgi:hypothetical protein